MRHGQSRASVRYTEDSARLPQHPVYHRPKDPILLAVDRELGGGATLRVAPELSDPVGALEVGQREDSGAARLGQRLRCRLYTPDSFQMFPESSRRQLPRSK
jgi:hypothetical protein